MNSLHLYVMKRGFCFLDEWLMYAVFLYMYKQRFPRWMICLTMLYGSAALFTSYKNLSTLENEMGMKDQWLLYPLIR